MTDDEVAAFLDEARDLQIATVGPDGAPHLVTMWYGLEDGRPVFWTYAKSQKVLNLRRDPRITVLIADGDSYNTLRGVSMTGHAEIRDDPDEVAAVGEAVHRRNAHRFGDVRLADQPPGEAEIDSGTRDMLRVMGAKRVGIVVHSETTASWDHRKLGGTY